MLSLLDVTSPIVAWLSKYILICLLISMLNLSLLKKYLSEDLVVHDDI